MAAIDLPSSPGESPSKSILDDNSLEELPSPPTPWPSPLNLAFTLFTLFFSLSPILDYYIPLPSSSGQQQHLQSQARPSPYEGPTFLNKPLGLVKQASSYFATRGSWVYAPSPEDDSPVLTLASEISTLFPDYRDYPAFLSSCGSAEARRLPLSLRYRFPGDESSTTPGAPYLPWDRAATCAALDGYAVILMGDSLSGEFTDTLVSALGPNPSTLRSFRSNVCGGRVPIFSIAAPRMTSTDFYPKWEEPTFYSGAAQNRLFWVEAMSEAVGEAIAATHFNGSKKEGGWASAAQEQGARIIWVLNRGAHYLPTAQHLESVEEAIELARGMAPLSSIFWRTCAPPHPDFIEAPLEVQNAPPLKYPLGVEAYGGYWSQNYKWWDFYSQNNITVASLPEDVVVLDVAPASALRHDSHCGRPEGQEPDGMHYCIPGPIDTWVEMFAALVRFAVGQ
jgi:hypothetical protein